MRRYWRVLLLCCLAAAAAVAQDFGGNPNPYGYSPYGGGYHRNWLLEFLTNRWLQHALAVVLGGLLGAFLSDRFKRFRAIICTAIFVVVLILLGVQSPSLANFMLFFGALWLAAWLLRDPAGSKGRNRSTAFGSAEWANAQHLNDNGVLGDTGLRFGFFAAGKNAYPLHYTGKRHILTVAPTRSGKGVSAVVPNLLTYAGSALVIDPKGENAMITALRRGAGDASQCIAGLGQNVHVVDPWAVTGLPAACFNPLDWLDNDDPDINENAMMLADAVIAPRAGIINADPFWDEEAKALLMGLLLHVAADEDPKRRTLARVRDIVTLPKRGPDDNAEALKTQETLDDVLCDMVDSANPIVSSTAWRTLSKEPKLLGSVLASVQSHTHFLDSPRIRESLSRSDFRFEDLKQKKTTVYLVLPADRLETFGRWLRLLVQQAITINSRELKQSGELPILFLLDEMPALGRLKMVEQAYGLMAGFGLQLWGIVQDLSQIERVYEKGWETFIGNSGVLQYFGSRDHKTAEYFSKLCGVTTVEKLSFAQSIARSFGSSGGHSTSSTTTTENTNADVIQRHLAFPDELMVLRGRQQLLLIENLNPIRGQRILWYEQPGYREHGVNQHAAAGAGAVSAASANGGLANVIPLPAASGPQPAPAAAAPAPAPVPAGAQPQAADPAQPAQSKSKDATWPELIGCLLLAGGLTVGLVAGLFFGVRALYRVFVHPAPVASASATPAASSPALAQRMPETPAASPWPDQARPAAPLDHGMDTAHTSFRADASTLPDAFAPAQLERDSPWQLVLLRNGIFAHHGRTFRSPSVQNYFNHQSWYRPDPFYTDASLTTLEHAEINALDAHEAAHPGLLQQEEAALKWAR